MNYHRMRMDTHFFNLWEDVDVKFRLFSVPLLFGAELVLRPVATLGPPLLAVLESASEDLDTTMALAWL